jgi:hypothetical protein
MLSKTLLTAYFRCASLFTFIPFSDKDKVKNKNLALGHNLFSSILFGYLTDFFG